MKSRPIRHTGVEVTELGFGAAPIGNLYREISDEQAHGAVSAAWDAGVRYFDTAPHYGLGESERRLGAALARYPREQYVLSTKVGRLLVPNSRPSGSDVAASFAVPDTLARVNDYSADGVRRSLDASLERLGTGRVDIVLVHDPQDHMEEALRAAVPALLKLRDEGVVAAVGAGMNFSAPLRRFVEETDVDVVMVAGRWTLLDRDAEGLLASCADRGVAVLAAAPFNSGLLARPWPADDLPYNYKPAPPELVARAQSLARICEQHGTSLPHAAMRFALRHPAVVSVVAGLDSAAQSASAASWVSRDDIDADVWADLDAVATSV
jgi:D-threo-aldose 1-dehydrogenase